MLQRFWAVEPIPNADKIVLVRVLGWQVIAKNGECVVGGLTVYVNIGTKLDKNNKHFEFLKGKAIKTCKMRGVVSQGLVIPINLMSDFGVDPATLKEGDDMTNIIGAEKWIPKEELELYNTDDPEHVKFPFPAMIPRTDEERVQNIIDELLKLKGLKVVVTQKFDGTSFTVAIVGDQFMVCGRRFLFIKKTKESVYYYKMVKRYNLEEKMRKLGRNVALQCEIIGLGINGNRHFIKDYEVYVFNIYDVDAQQYLDWDEIIAITTELGLKTVPCIYQGEMKEEWFDSDNLLKLAEEQNYGPNIIAEGIVLKTDSRTYPFRFSCKAISNKYLLKYKLV